MQRAIQLLSLLADDARSSPTALELARSTGLHRTVVHRLLRTLAREGLVEERNGHYAMGPRTIGWANGYLDRVGVREAALPYAISLHQSLEGTPWIVSLAVPAWDSAVLIDRLWKPEAPLDSLLDVGTRLPLTTSAVGRCLLAYASDPHVQLRYEHSDELAQRLAEIRAAGGVEWSSHELQPGISALASVILSREQAPTGAIAVSGPGLETDLQRDSDVAQRLRRAAEAIGRALR